MATEDVTPDEAALALAVGEQMLAVCPLSRFKTGRHGIKLHAYGELPLPDGTMERVRVDLQVTILPAKRREFPVTVTRIEPTAPSGQPVPEPVPEQVPEPVPDEDAADSWGTVVVRGGPGAGPE